MRPHPSADDARRRSGEARRSIRNNQPTAFSFSPQRATCVVPRWRDGPLEGGLGVLEEHLEVGLVPLAGLGRGLEGVGLAAERVVAGGALVARAVRLAAGLAPDEGVGEAVARRGRRAHAEARAVDVAPVAPLLAQARHGVAARVDDGVVREPRRLQRRPELLHVRLLVLARVVLGVRRRRELAGAQVPRVPTRDVGRPAAHLLRAARVLVHLGQLLRAGLQVGVPAEPAAVAGIDVHDDVGEVEALESVCDALLVRALAVLASLQVRVGHEVGERVGLDDEGKGRVRVGLELRHDGYVSLSTMMLRRGELQRESIRLRSM